MDVEITPEFSKAAGSLADLPAYCSPEGGLGSLWGTLIDPERPLVYLSEELPAGSVRTLHDHPRGQLAWATSGVLRVNTEEGSWVVPPSHAVWITGGLRHEVEVLSPAFIRYLFTDPSIEHRLPDRCQVMTVTPLLRELVLRLLTLDVSGSLEAKDQRLVEVIVDELGSLESTPLYLPSGTDRRLKALMESMSRNPADTRPLPELAADVGASPRTIERLFQAEAGMGFRQWRTRLRLLQAIQRLSEGETSAAIAQSLGYSSSSAFVAAFRRYFGKPPQSFVSLLSADESIAAV
ncbi:MAG: AraC family transcriptional regulator [Oceanobacter sp.]